MTYLTRRDVVIGGATLFGSPALAQIDDRTDAKRQFEAEFNGLPFQTKGIEPSLPEDVNTANQIVGSSYLRSNNPFEIMVKLELLGTTNRGLFRSRAGHAWNERWPDHANPLLIRFFRDLGYHHTPYPGDCTPWCAATVSWCLQRAGFKTPSDPASSQSFKSYGTPVVTPQHGDLCVFGDVGDPAHGHVGFFVERRGAAVRVLGGNQDNLGPTTCGADYPHSHIGRKDIPINPHQDRKVGYHYLIKYVRPIG